MEKKHKITVRAKYFKFFLPALFLVMGTFFGCQNKEDKKQEIENLQVITDTSTTKSTTVDKTEINNKIPDQTPESQIKIGEIKNAKPEKNNNSKPEKKSNSEAEKADNKHKTILKETAASGETSSQINAEFPGGIDQFYTFFMKEYKKPESVYYWKLNFKLAFAVEKNGSMSFLECSPPVEEPMEKEIIRVLSLCPKWQPGELNRKKIRMQYSLPISLHNTQ